MLPQIWSRVGQSHREGRTVKQTKKKEPFPSQRPIRITWIVYFVFLRPERTIRIFGPHRRAITRKVGGMLLKALDGLRLVDCTATFILFL